MGSSRSDKRLALEPGCSHYSLHRMASACPCPKCWAGAVPGKYLPSTMVLLAHSCIIASVPLCVVPAGTIGGSVPWFREATTTTAVPLLLGDKGFV